MAKVTIDIQPRGTTSAYINAPFDEGMEALQKQGFSIISLEQNAQLRIQNVSRKEEIKYGNWTREGVLYVPQKGIFLTKRSPVLANAREATQCNREGKDYYLTNDQVEQALEDAVEITSKVIPAADFKNNPLTAYAFGASAEAYGQILQEAGIEIMPILSASTQDKPFVRQLWFGSLYDDSELNGDMYLDYDVRVRGVLVCAEGTRQNRKKVNLS